MATAVRQLEAAEDGSRLLRLVGTCGNGQVLFAPRVTSRPAAGL